MRVFYAVKFADYVKQALTDSLEEIRKHTLRGSFTARDNFHITLVFVGECEVSELDSLRKAAAETVKKLDLSKILPIKGTIDGLGTFARPGEELLWAGVKTNPENILGNINKTLLGELSNCGINVKEEHNKFSPHVTIARKVEFWRISSKDINQIKFPPINFNINAITLMESIQDVTVVKDSGGERRYTKIIYKPLYESKF
ncbi:MAG: RNA 2',3'-cyclic phosphodiesterase [Oscillospiraceae bacterium]|nr:RNA 2',3'-cyclic phosphodiesterase [Oscillospiraceae bacterium]